MSSEKRITFKSFEHTSYRRKNIAILRSIYPEIQSYIASGCTWEDIYEALKAEPYNLDMTLGSLHNAIYRIRSDLKKKPQNQLSSAGGVYQNQRPVVTAPQNPGGAELPKGAKIFKKMNSDAPKFEQNPNPSLDELLKGNNNG
ncbi:hypothetical protein GHL40_005177 [Escherichia coli]|uniref:hypothetical protein n=1 Tax=Salmonella enterica TaxID=28901 RepID=UPI0009ACA580|nr:hypothetical protein [Salmonella enterica]EBR0135140.1 hypothetical protein [Salmonella enterica subsp. enterica serovar Agona]ECV9488281.1 hypothetical protein [Salmonella enterica subsp. enterica serovar Enteritidis]EEQ9509109.1 hypothetical protein [Escherichia coli]EGM4539718.1 hypothetical protein [Salmonella enterica subsp. enterica serovar Infantis]EAS7891431.1 hypothetical protein [Salmonella enterica]